jgi:hypothetical protein
MIRSEITCPKGAEKCFFRARKGHQNVNPGINLLIQKRKGPVLEILASEKVYPGPYRARIEGEKQPCMGQYSGLQRIPAESFTGNDMPPSAR